MLGVTGPGRTGCVWESQAQDTQDVYGGHRPRTHRVCRGVTGPGHTTVCREGGGGHAGQDAQDVEGGSQTQDTQSVQRGHVGCEGSQGEGAVVRKDTEGGNQQKKEKKKETAKWWPYWGQKACRID